MREAYQLKTPTPKLVKYGKTIKYQCPLCSSGLEQVHDEYNERDHVAYECYECGYEWIES
jgi:uncharacterized Zn finger protein